MQNDSASPIQYLIINMMKIDFNKLHNIFFIGIAGTGMSAIAQFLAGKGKSVAGSDRQFSEEDKKTTQLQLEEVGIGCFYQDGSGITQNTDIVVISTAIEESNVEYQKAVQLGIPLVMRSDMLAAISDGMNTIAVGGTSGKSTTTAMIFHVLEYAGLKPSLITGAGLTSLQKKGSIGNSWVGESEWLVIESDESDGSIVKYQPEVGVLLNIDRDHKEFDELISLFETFQKRTKTYFTVNADDIRANKLSINSDYDFSVKGVSGFVGENFVQEGYKIRFICKSVSFEIPVIGKHNMENALACISVCSHLQVDLNTIAEALRGFEGIYRRTQVVGEKNGVVVIDDFAHNPAEVAAAIRACQGVGKRVLAWFQPHGYGPLRFMHEELSEELSNCLGSNDIIYLSNVYYAGGTVNKDIESDVVSEAVLNKNKQARYFPNRESVKADIAETAVHGDVVLLMGARDTTLANFALEVLNSLA